MQCILREKLLAQALKLGQVGDTYRRESHLFVAAYLQWLDETERELAALRSPLSTLLQGEKGALTAVADGFVPAQVQAGKSVRQRQKAIAALSLERVAKEMQAKIEQIDHGFEQLNEKLCHAIAVLASKEPGLYDRLEANQQGIATLWSKLASIPETLPMFNYFSAKMTATDRDYLLIDILRNVLGNRLPAPPPDTP